MQAKHPPVPQSTTTTPTCPPPSQPRSIDRSINSDGQTHLQAAPGRPRRQRVPAACVEAVPFTAGGCCSSCLLSRRYGMGPAAPQLFGVWGLVGLEGRGNAAGSKKQLIEDRDRNDALGAKRSVIGARSSLVGFPIITPTTQQAPRGRRRVGCAFERTSSWDD